MANDYGDVELSPEGMRALAHPVRLKILFQLRRGPATATHLSASVGATPSVTSWHLRQLAAHGLVVDAPELGSGRERYWRGTSGFRFEAGDEAGQLAAAALQDTLDSVQGDVVGTWRRDARPNLEASWLRHAGSSDTTVSLTLGELIQVNRAVEQLLAPYVTRTTPPDQARRVRIVRHVMPSPPA